MTTDNLSTSISIEIDTNGDAFTNGPHYDPGAEIARILREIADRVEWDDATAPLPLIDHNGNHVGRYEHHAAPIR